MLNIHRIRRTLVVFILAAACCEVRAAEPSTPIERFFVAAAQRYRELDPQVKSYRERALACVQTVEGLAATYDAIMTTESGRFRDTLIANYRRNLPAAISETLNLEEPTAAMTADLDEAYDFLHRKEYAEYARLTIYQDLDETIKQGRRAIGALKQIPRLPALPDPIPDPVKPAEVVDVTFSDLDLTQDTWYPVEVRVKNNARYTERNVNVEIRVRSGPAKIKGSVFKKVVVPAGATKVLTWQFMATGDGEFDIGARVVPPTP